MLNIKYLFFLLVLNTACFSHVLSDLSFDQLMGKLSFVETPEDVRHYSAFKKLYEDNIGALRSMDAINVIPKTIHFVWLGPDGLPSKLWECMDSWVQYHPTWNVYLWTDHPHPSPHPSVQRKSIDLLAKSLCSFFPNIDNTGVQSHILRLLILEKFGGVVLDCDVACTSAVDEITSKVQFVSTALYPKKPFLSSSVCAAIFFIASKPHHPIIENALSSVVKEWNTIERCFTSDDQESLTYRAAYHTYVPFTDAILDFAKEKDFILPADYFGKKAILGRHLELQSWNKNAVSFEKMAYSQCRMLAKRRQRSDRMMYLLCLLSSLFFIGGLIVLISPATRSQIFLRRIKKDTMLLDKKK